MLFFFFIDSLLVVFILSISFARPSTEMSLIEKAARLCCPIHRLECCAERLGNNKTVLLNTCSMSYQEKVDVINCVQQELYGEVEMRKLSYNDSKCCIVWKDNFNDEDETCFNNCINTLGTPTIQAEAKIARMEKCKTRFSAIYGCFDECYNHYHDKYNGSVTFNFTQQCSQESFIERLEPSESLHTPFFKDVCAETEKFYAMMVRQDFLYSTLTIFGVTSDGVIKDS